jgi:sugar phosphate isomerase/epimerase
MKISFMTLGCPAWSLDDICAKGKAYGFDGVDFRGYREGLDITLLPEFTSQVAETRRQLDGAGLAVSAVSSSITVCVAERREANIEEARRTIPVAKALGARNVRIFGGGNLEGSSRLELAKIGRGCIEDILALDGARELNWLFETHDLWIQSQDCRLLLDAIPAPFGALWDMGHTSRVGGETPAQTWAAIGPRVGYTHIKDAVYSPGHPQAMEDGWRYVPPGKGQLPLKESIDLLRAEGYDGWLQFEHEKRWHPALPEPEEIFPQFVQWVRGVL